MLQTLTATLLLASCALIPGLPPALFLSAYRSRGLTHLVYDALFLGSSVTALMALVLMRLDILQPVTFLAGIGMTAATGALVVALTGRRPLKVKGPSLLGAVAIIAVAAGALFLRSKPSPFVFQIGDMGEYVIQSELIARGETLLQSFPHLFPAWLSVPPLLLPSLPPAAGMPFAGLLVIGGTARVTSLFSRSLIPPTFIACLTAILVVPTWFSVFPASESLSAALLIGCIGFLFRAELEEEPWDALVAGALLFPLLLTRGSALILGPAVALGHVYAAALGDSSILKRSRLFTSAALAGLAVGHLYDLTYLPRYYVDNQLRGQLPPSVFSAAQKAGWLEQSPLSLLLPAAGLAAILAVGWGVNRIFSRIRSAGLGLSWMDLAAPLSLVLTALAVGSLGVDGTLAAFGRYGLVFPALTLVGLVAGPRMTRSTDVGCRSAHFVTLLFWVAAVVLFARRVPTDRGHAFFLYLDRYLFSEGFPPAAAMAGMAVSGIWAKLSEWATSARFRRSSAAVLSAASALLLLPLTMTTWRVVDEQFLGGADGLLEDIDNAAVERSTPIIYGATSLPPEWIFPNTFRAIALPLQQLHGREILNMPANPFAGDPTVTGDGVARLMAERDLDEVYVLVFFDESAPPTLYSEGLSMEEIGVAEATIPVISKSVGGGEDHRLVEFDLLLYLAVRV